MFTSQNKQVSPKFQNSRNSRTICSKYPPTIAVGGVPASKVPLSSPCIQPLRSTATTGTLQRPRTSAARTVPPSSRLRSATLGRTSRPFLSTGRTPRPSSSKIFDYDLSDVEQRYFGQFRSPMKTVPLDELQLLRSGQRATYLETRYGRTPDNKYNYPEATSWRYGWFHRNTE
ncbi:hypothetical protein KR222_007233 [Zaprionus bogoriensis]|nr:hypothetical protein KR222_007233 [Zaprionus bogoriensis]